MVKVLAVILGTILMALMSLGAIYFWGLGQVFPKYDHPFFVPKTPWLVVPRSFEAELAAHPEDIVWIDVFRNSNQVLVVDRIDSGVNLVDVLTQYKSHRIILNIKSNVDEIDAQLAALLPPYLESTPILLQSEFDIILRSTKESLANLPFGSSQSDRLRLNSFEGMAPWNSGLLPAAPFHGDVYIAPIKWRNVPLIDENIAKEIHRRQKYFILGPLVSEAEVQQAKGLGADGFFVTAESLLATLHPQAVAH